jgi:death-on-curing protein
LERAPYFLTEKQVLRLHAEQIKKFGGEEGVLDEGAVFSAVAAPQNLWLYTDCSVFRLAASYAFNLANNHGFIDGNKRTAAACAVVFLRVNGIIVTRGFENEILDVVAGKMSRDQLAEFLQSISRRSILDAITNFFKKVRIR